MCFAVETRLVDVQDSKPSREGRQLFFPFIMPKDRSAFANIEKLNFDFIDIVL